MRISEIQGAGKGERRHIGVVVSTFNRVVTDGLLAGALEALKGAGTETVTIVRVPGALEIPLAARRLIDAGHDGVVAIGAVIKGETDHYVHVATQSISGIASVSVSTGAPIGNAILTVTEYEHARERALPGPANKGFEAAKAVLVTLDALEAISRP